MSERGRYREEGACLQASRVADLSGIGHIGLSSLISAANQTAPTELFQAFEFDAGGMSVAHTWHPTLDDAKAKAGADYGIGVSDWVEEDATSSR